MKLTSTGKIILSSIIMVAVVALYAITSAISANNYGVTAEATLRAAKDNNKNILGQYEQRVLEMVQVPEMYKDDFKEVISSSVQGRYGANGSQAMMQWLKEHEINFDSSLYKNIQDVIAGGRKDFELAQTKMIDIRRGYETNLGYFVRGFWLRYMGFPKVNLSEYEPVVTTRVEEVFQNRIETAPLKLR